MISKIRAYLGTRLDELFLAVARGANTAQSRVLEVFHPIVYILTAPTL